MWSVHCQHHYDTLARNVCSFLPFNIMPCMKSNKIYFKIFSFLSLTARMLIDKKKLSVMFAFWKKRTKELTTSVYRTDSTVSFVGIHNNHNDWQQVKKYKKQQFFHFFLYVWLQLFNFYKCHPMTFFIEYI